MPQELRRRGWFSLLVILEQTVVAKGLAGRYVEIFDYFDKLLDVRWQCYVLPYRVFNKDQIVPRVAVVENKRLRHALSVVRAKQEQKLEVKIMTNSEKIGYKKLPHTSYGRGHEPFKSPIEIAGVRCKRNPIAEAIARSFHMECVAPKR